MDDSGQTGLQGQRRLFSGRLPLLYLSLFMLLMLLAVLWVLRVNIADNLVQRALDSNNVVATYEIEDIGFRRQIIRNLSIGDSDKPDLFIKRAELEFDFWNSGTDLVAVNASGVRLHGVLRDDGQFRFGELDKLRDLESKEPFVLPEFDAVLKDAQINLITPYGAVHVALDGRGKLDNGFAGSLNVKTGTLGAAGCEMASAAYQGSIKTDDSRPILDGKLSADTLNCSDQAVSLVHVSGPVNLSLSNDLASWNGDVQLVGKGLLAADASIALAGVNTRFYGKLARTELEGELQASTLQYADSTAARLDSSFAGNVRSAEGSMLANLQMKPVMRGIKMGSSLAAKMDGFAESMAGTPLEPIGAGLAESGRAAARNFAAAAEGELLLNPQEGNRFLLSNLQMESVSGVKLLMGNKVNIGLDGSIDWLDGGGLLRLAGGGFPNMALQLRQQPKGGYSGLLQMAPYRQGNAELSVPNMQFSAATNGATRVNGMLSLSGPMQGGYIKGLQMPVIGGIGADGSYAFQPGCFPLSFSGLTYNALVLPASAMNICSIGPALVQGKGSKMQLAGRTSGLRLSGQYEGKPASIKTDALAFGYTPDSVIRMESSNSALSIASKNASLTAGKIAFVYNPDGNFIVQASKADLKLDGQNISADSLAANSKKGMAAKNVSYVSGSGDEITRVNIAIIEGLFRGSVNALTGRFSGLSGKLGSVPLYADEGKGGFVYKNGRAEAQAEARLTDTEAEPRFTPLLASDIRIVMQDGRIFATTPLVSEKTGRELMTVEMDHQLTTLEGRAIVKITDLKFDKGQKPEELLPVFYGLVSDVKGHLSGVALVEWKGSNVTSKGDFMLKDTDLSAPFGPVKGLSTRLQFDDLINLKTLPSQIATMRSVNPGVEALNGVVRYQMLPGNKIIVEGAEWPFAGGKLIMKPSSFDMSSEQTRYLEFYLDGLDAATFVREMGYENITATGTFSGSLPMEFDRSGGRIVGGRLDSQGKGTVAYVGQLSYEDMGAMANYAFSALRAVQYDSLVIMMNGRIDGELVTKINFSGVQQGEGTSQNFVTKQLKGLPIEFNVTITAPFMQLFGSLRDFNDPALLIERNLDDLIAEQDRVEADEARERGK